MSWYKRIYNSVVQFNPYRDTYNASPDNSGSPVPPTTDYLLLEDGQRLLLEDGSSFLLESST